jgi:hypothetical protein
MHNRIQVYADMQSRYTYIEAHKRSPRITQWFPIGDTANHPDQQDNDVEKFLYRNPQDNPRKWLTRA